MSTEVVKVTGNMLSVSKQEVDRTEELLKEKFIDPNGNLIVNEQMSQMMEDFSNSNPELSVRIQNKIQEIMTTNPNSTLYDVFEQLKSTFSGEEIVIPKSMKSGLLIGTGGRKIKKNKSKKQRKASKKQRKISKKQRKTVRKYKIQKGGMDTITMITLGIIFFFMYAIWSGARDDAYKKKNGIKDKPSNGVVADEYDNNVSADLLDDPGSY